MKTEAGSWRVDGGANYNKVEDQLENDRYLDLCVGHWRE